MWISELMSLPGPETALLSYIDETAKIFEPYLAYVWGTKTIDSHDNISSDEVSPGGLSYTK